VAVGDRGHGFVQATAIRTGKTAVQYVVAFVVTILQEERATYVPAASRGVSFPSCRVA
jgi:hypothetical protein